jgi:hypothetical protein
MKHIFATGTCVVQVPANAAYMICREEGGETIAFFDANGEFIVAANTEGYGPSCWPIEVLIDVHERARRARALRMVNA